MPTKKELEKKLKDCQKKKGTCTKTKKRKLKTQIKSKAKSLAKAEVSNVKKFLTNSVITQSKPLQRKIDEVEKTISKPFLSDEEERDLQRQLESLRKDPKVKKITKSSQTETESKPKPKKVLSIANTETINILDVPKNRTAGVQTESKPKKKLTESETTSIDIKSKPKKTSTQGVQTVPRRRRAITTTIISDEGASESPPDEFPLPDRRRRRRRVDSDETPSDLTSGEASEFRESRNKPSKRIRIQSEIELAKKRKKKEELPARPPHKPMVDTTSSDSSSPSNVSPSSFSESIPSRKKTAPKVIPKPPPPPPVSRPSILPGLKDFFSSGPFEDGGFGTIKENQRQQLIDELKNNPFFKSRQDLDS